LRELYGETDPRTHEAETTLAELQGARASQEPQPEAP